MKCLFAVLVLAVGAIVPSAALAQDADASNYGVGPHGFDWIVGTWSCTNAMPSAIGGPVRTTLTVSKTNAGVILYRSVGSNFDNSWYDIYVAAKKGWVSPFIVSDGSYGTESTSQSGKKIVWLGTAYMGATGKAVPIRDTNVNSANKYTDLGEYRSSDGWKTQYSVTCTRA